MKKITMAGLLASMMIMAFGAHARSPLVYKCNEDIVRYSGEKNMAFCGEKFIVGYSKSSTGPEYAYQIHKATDDNTPVGVYHELKDSPFAHLPLTSIDKLRGYEGLYQLVELVNATKDNVGFIQSNANILPMKPEFNGTKNAALENKVFSYVRYLQDMAYKISKLHDVITFTNPIVGDDGYVKTVDTLMYIPAKNKLKGFRVEASNPNELIHLSASCIEKTFGKRILPMIEDSLWDDIKNEVYQDINFWAEPNEVYERSPKTC